MFTPYGGIVLDVTQWASVYYSYTDIFQPNDPFLKDVSGNVLPPEIGVNQEVGLKTEFYDGKLNTWLAFFRIDHSNLAELDPNAPPFFCNGADCYRARDQRGHRCRYRRGAIQELERLRRLHLSASDLRQTAS